MQNNRKMGADGENIASKYLENKGYKILERNFWTRLGEIDIIAQDGSYIVFVEVKYRDNTRYGYPREAVHYYKQRTITKVALYYLKIKGIYNYSCRFDVVEIVGKHPNNKITLITNAFDAVM